MSKLKPKALYTTAEAAEALGVTPGRIRQMIVNGILTAEKLGRDRVICAEDLEAAKKRKTTPGPIANSQPGKTAKKRTGRAAKK